MHFFFGLPDFLDVTGASQFLAQRLHRLGRVLCRSDAPGWGTEESSGDD